MENSIMIKYLIYATPIINKDLPYGLCPIVEELPYDNSIYLFTDETKEEVSEKGYQAFVEEYLSVVLGFKLCLIKEAAAGHTGSVDFLGVDENGKLFLIEVKKEYHEARSKFDVVFQSVKYFIDPQSIRKVLFGKGGQSFMSEVGNKFIDKFPEKKNNINDVQDNINKNLEAHAINVLIVIDRATPQLISTAYTLFLRHTQSECRVLEMTPVKISGNTYLYYRKYFSSDDWADASSPDNRSPHLEKIVRLNNIDNSEIRNIIDVFIQSLQKDERYSFKWNTDSIPYFSLYYKPDKGQPKSLGIQFYTEDWDYGPKNVGNIKSGSILFVSQASCNTFLKEENYHFNELSYKAEKNIWYYFVLMPEDIVRIGVDGLEKLVKSFRKEIIP
jgi:hypothetical protein